MACHNSVDFFLEYVLIFFSALIQRFGWFGAFFLTVVVPITTLVAVE